MTMVSKYPVDAEVKRRVYEIFLLTLAKLKTTDEVGLFLEEFLTPTEKIMLAKRLSIQVLLTKGYSFRQICKILRVSINTVKEANIWIKHKKGYLSKVIENFIKQEENKEFWNNIEYKIGAATIPLTVGNWSNRRRDIEKEHFSTIKPF